MKLSFTFLMALCLLFAGVLSTAVASQEHVISEMELKLNRHDPAVAAQIAEQCGKLGIMPVPEGADPAKIRLCINHPHGLHLKTTDDVNTLAPQACWGRDSYGCSDGSCFMSCGKANGGKGPSYNWCWMVEGTDGGNNFLPCSEGSECKPGQGNGCSSCGGFWDRACGCSCN